LAAAGSRDPELILLRASIGSALVGVVGYTVKGTDVVVLHIATSEDTRRTGVGRRMLQAVTSIRRDEIWSLRYDGGTRLAQVGHHQEAELGSIDRLGAPLY
jgi:hypothetical protein